MMYNLTIRNTGNPYIAETHCIGVTLREVFEILREYPHKPHATLSIYRGD